MKQFFAFVNKEFCHILRDKRTMLILLVMPVVQIILFGFAISTEVKHIRTAVYDLSNDVTSQQLCEHISNNAYFDITHIIHSQEEIDALFRKNEADLILVFKEKFGEDLFHTGTARVQLIADATDPNVATTAFGYASSIIAAYQEEITQSLYAPSFQIIPETRLLYNPHMKSAYNFVPGVMGLILMLICAMMTSISIVREKERGTMEVLLASPVRPLSIILAKLIPYLVLSVINLTTILLLSVLVLSVPVAGSIVQLGIVSLIFILVALSLGLLVSTLVQTQVAAMLASGMVLMLPVILLSGMIFPIESMPWPLQWISHIIPARWYIAAVRKIMIEGLSIVYVWKEVGILVGMAVMLMAVSLKKFKYRLE